MYYSKKHIAASPPQNTSSCFEHGHSTALATFWSSCGSPSWVSNLCSWSCSMLIASKTLPFHVLFDFGEDWEVPRHQMHWIRQMRIYHVWGSYIPDCQVAIGCWNFIRPCKKIPHESGLLEMLQTTEGKWISVIEGEDYANGIKGNVPLTAIYFYLIFIRYFFHVLHVAYIQHTCRHTQAWLQWVLLL